MNKKFSTLVAALLVSGGLAYTVGAMVTPATEGAAQFVMAVGTGEEAGGGAETPEAPKGVLIGYNTPSTETFAAAWKVKTVEAANYLTVASNATETWVLCEDGSVVKVTADASKKASFEAVKALAIVLEAETNLIKVGDKYLSIADGKITLEADKAKGNALLFTDAKTIIGEISTSAVGLGVAKTVYTDITAATLSLTSEVTAPEVTAAAAAAYVAPDGENGTWESTTIGAAKFNLDGTKIYTENGTVKYYLVVNQEGTGIEFVTEANKANASDFAITAETYTITLGGKYLKVSDGTVSLAGSAESGKNVYAFEAAAALSTNPAGDFYLGNAADEDAANLVEVIEASSKTLRSGGNKSVAPIKFTAEAPALDGTALAAFTTDLSFEQNPTKSFTVDAAGKISFGTFEKAYLKVAGDGITFETTDKVDEAAVFTLEEGVLKVGEKYVYNNSTALGLGDATAAAANRLGLYAAGETNFAAQPTTTLAAGTYAMAVVTAKQEAASVINTIEVRQEVPGLDIEGMDKISVKADSTINVAEGVSLTDIPAPTTITFAAGTLTIDGEGKLVLATEADAVGATSWVLVGGKYKCVELEKMGKTKIWLKAPEVSTPTSGKATRAVTVSEYSLVEETEATEFIVKSTGLTTKAGTALGAVALKINGIAPASDVNASNKVNYIQSVNNGDVINLGQGSNYAGTDMQLYTVEVNNIGGVYYYAFKLKDTEEYLTITDEASKKYSTFTSSVAYDGSVMLKAENGQYLVINADGSFGFSTVATYTTFYKATVSLGQFSADFILKNHGTQSSFNLSLWDKKDGSNELIQNPFADADLVPMKWDATKQELVKADAATDLQFFLKKGSSYIVLDVTEGSTWGNISDQVTDGGYKFTTLSAAAMLKLVKEGSIGDKKTYAPYFQFNYDKNAVANGTAVTNTPIYSIQVAKATTGETWYNLVTFEVKTGTQKGIYLTVNKALSNGVYAKFSANNLITGDMDKDYNPLNMKYVNIQFANHPSVEYGGMVLNGNALAADTGVKDTDKSLFSKPEGQWVVTMQIKPTKEAEGASLSGDELYQFSIENRESGVIREIDKLYYLGDHRYAIQWNSRFVVYSGGTRDTVLITPAPELKNNTVQMDGYANFKAEEVKDVVYNLLVASTEQDYYVGENHTAKSHFLGLSHDKANAVNWRIVPLTEKRSYDSDGLLKTATDSIYRINKPMYYKASDKKFYEYTDTLAIIGYALQNTANNEYLTYETPRTTNIQSMICDPKFKDYQTTKDLSSAYRFALKEKADGLYNIIGVDYPSYDKEGYVQGTPYATLNLDKKLYGATTLTKQGAVEVEHAYAQINSNDLFKVQRVDAPEYRKMAQGDTIRIFRDENDFDTMYENGEFLNLGNKAQLTDIAPALYVDTAYVTRGANSRYQYLLAVNVDRVEPAHCDIPNHPALHPDTTYGRFLVNLVDSAVYAYKNGAIHTNKYINDKEADETYVKTGFVWGYRTSDKLYLTEGNDFAKVKDVIDLSTNDFNIAKFAFHYVNPVENKVDGAFKIQTRYVDYNSAISTAKKADWTSHNNGYLKTINGVVVVTSSFAKGEVFNLAAEKSAPTSNGQIGATEVSVIASTGSVIVKGAAGKTVTVSNILGQAIVTTVLTSDNATIAVPAGIVVVAVEGEEAVKTVVR